MKAIALQKSSQIQCGCASIFDVTPLTHAWGTLLAPAQFHNRPLPDPDTWQAPAQNPALLKESTRIGLDLSEWRGECPENGALEALSLCHMEPFSMWHDRRADGPPSFITYHGTIPMPTNWQTTSGIHRRNPACGRQAPRKSGCAGGVGLSRCRLLVQPAVYQGLIQLVWRIKPASCGRAHIQFENQSNPTNLNNPNKYNKYINYNNDNK